MSRSIVLQNFSCSNFAFDGDCEYAKVTPMATNRRTTKKRKTTRKKKTLLSRLNVKALLSTMALTAFLFFSLGVLVYVVFLNRVPVF